MIKRHSVIVVALGILSLFSQSKALAAECSAVFPNAVQSNHTKKIEIKSGAHLFNTGDRILFTEDLSSHSTACDGQSCIEGGSKASSGDFNNFKGKNNVDESDSPLDPGEYKNLTLSNDSTLVLEPGEYTFKESVSIADGAKITINGAGTVRFYAKKAITTGASVEFNSAGGTSLLFIYSREQITIGDSNTINAVLYSKKGVTIKDNTTLNGAINAKEDIVIESGASIYFESADVAAIDFDGFCEGPTIPQANDDNATVAKGAAVNVNLAANDSGGTGIDLSSITIVSGPNNGSVIVNADGTVDYTHDDGASLSDSFTYQIKDSAGTISNIASVNITIAVVASCEAVFPGGIQTHGVTGYIRVHEKGSYTEPEIYNSGSLLSTVSIIDHDNSSLAGDMFCGASPNLCTASGTSAASNTVSIAANSSTTDVTANGTLGDSGTNNYRNITIAKNGFLTFSDDYSDYYIQKLVLGDDTTLTLAAGTYWISDALTIGKRSSLVVSGSGVVQIYVGDKIDFKDESQINTGGTSGQLLVYSNSSGGSKFKMSKKTDAKGYFFSQGSMEFKEESTLFGGLSGNNIDHIDYGATITYEAPSTNFPLFCDSSPAAVNHYAISYDNGATFNEGLGITCEGAAVTFVAHDADHNLVLPTNGTDINLSTVPSSGIWHASGINTITYTFDGSKSSDTLYLQQFTSADLNIDVNSGNEGLSEDEDISFSNSALLIVADSNSDGDADDLDSNGFSDPIPNQIAGIDYSQAIVRAMKTDESTGACVSALNSVGTLAIKLAYECINPDSCVLDKDLIAAGTAINENNKDATIDFDGVSLDLAFDADGEAPLVFRYDDVGQIKLHAEVTIPAFEEDPEITLSGSSTGFVVRPDDMVLSRVEDSLGVINPASTSSGQGFVIADAAFTVKVEVRNGQGRVTPNYGNETTPETIALALKTRIFPPSSVGGVLSNGTSFSGSGGIFTNTNVKWSDVGTIKLEANIGDNNYLDSGNITAPTESDNIGRFYPDHYELSLATLDNTCSNFSYMSQPGINLTYTVKALNASGGELANYDNKDLTYPVASLSYSVENNNAGVELNNRLTVAPGLWDDGVYLLADSGVEFSRLLTGPDGPYSSVQIGTILNDALDSRVLQGLDMNASTSDDCVASANCAAHSLGSGLDVRYGRLTNLDAHGPESSPLPVILKVDYWNGSSFITNADDSSSAPASDGCTSILRSRLLFDSANTLTDFDVDFTGGSTTGAVTSDVTDVFFTGGSAELVFSAPLVTGDFSLQVINVAEWLRADWDQDGLWDDTDHPETAISFGHYRGHDRIIYWREILN